MTIDNAWERIKKGLKEGAALSMEKIEEYTKVGKLKIEEYSAKRKIERNMVDIGEKVYTLMNDGRGNEIEKDVIIAKAIENIKTLKDELVEIEAKIKEILKDNQKGAAGSEEDEITGI